MTQRTPVSFRVPEQVSPCCEMSAKLVPPLVVPETRLDSLEKLAITPLNFGAGIPSNLTAVHCDGPPVCGSGSEAQSLLCIFRV